MPHHGKFIRIEQKHTHEIDKDVTSKKNLTKVNMKSEELNYVTETRYEIYEVEMFASSKAIMRDP